MSLRTFLIADVRGYTTYTRENGDEAAARLAAEFAEIVRRVCAERDGLLLELRGDEALVVFTSARQALHGAVELQQAFQAANLPRGVGIGLDAGEAIPVGDGYRGGALNLAARLCAKAHAGDVLASETVIHLAARIEGIAYLDARTFRLKGYAEPVRAVDVVAEDNVAPRIVRKMRRVRSRIKADRKVYVAIAIMVVTALLATFVLQVLPRGTQLSGLPAGTALLDAKSGRVLVRKISSSVPNQTGTGGYWDGHLWLLSLKPALFIQVDARTGKTLKRIAWPVSDIGKFTVGDGDVWLTDNESPAIVKMDVKLEREVDRFQIKDSSSDESTGGGILVAAGSVWVARFTDHGQEVFRVDPATGKILRLFTDVAGSGALAYGDGSIWTSSRGGVSRIDLATNKVIRARVNGAIRGVAAGGGFGWVAEESKGVVYKIDPNGNVVETYATGDGAADPVYVDGRVWVANVDEGTITSIDAITGARTTLRFSHPVNLAIGGGVLAVDIGQGRSYEDRIDALKGKVAKLFTGLNDVPEDAAIASGPFVFQIEAATCARLLNYPDVAGPDAVHLQPELAASMPAVTNGRRTYMFQINPGYRFSPPSNQSVSAETVRYSIERALSPKLGQDLPGPQTIADIAGEDEFRAGKADHISGLKASGNTLSITLTRPSPDFLVRLAEPYFCPVPTGTPFTPGAADQTLPGSDGVVPSAGPYYIADHLNGEYIILKRNPNYTGPRPHKLDAIALRMGVDPGRAVQRVDNDHWDGITTINDPILSPTGALATRWGPRSDAAGKGDQRFYNTPLPNADYLVFNENHGPFRDARLRRTAASALNRSVLASTFDEIPDDRFLTGAFPEVSGGHVYPLDAAAPNAIGHRVTVRMPVPRNCAEHCRPFADAVTAQLGAVGIDVQLKEVDDYGGAVREPNAPFDLFNGFTAIDYPDGASFLNKALLEDTPKGWVTASIHRLVEGLDNRSGGDRQRAAITLAQKLIREDASVAVFGVIGTPEFFSPHLGCRVFHPFGFGVDLAALCVT